MEGWLRKEEPGLEQELASPHACLNNEPYMIYDIKKVARKSHAG
jgi:hypothetical protein